MVSVLSTCGFLVLTLLLWGSSVRSDAEHRTNMYFEVIQLAIILLTELLTVIFSGSLCFHLTALQQQCKI